MPRIGAALLATVSKTWATVADAADRIHFCSGGCRLRFAFHRQLEPSRALFLHSLGNWFLTRRSHMATGHNLNDMECGYKVFRRDLLQKISVEEPRFGFEPEIVAKLARSAARIYEVCVDYYGCTHAEGKKINWKDGISAIRCVIKYGLLRRLQSEPQAFLTICHKERA